MKTPKYILILLISLSSFSFAQETPVGVSNLIKDINSLGESIISSKTDSAKKVYNDAFRENIKLFIETKGSFDIKLDSVKRISVLKAGDLKIYNWVLPFTDGTFEYFAFLQIKISKDEFKIIELTDKSSSIKTPENKILTAKNWYGALYYKIIHDKKLGKNYYTLLGWDGNNKLTNKKIIDVINISNNGIVKFGAPIFKTKKKTKKRIIFEYSENTVMSLKYHHSIEKIVFDFLVPASSKLTGVYEYYGPSLNRFDAFSTNKGKWIYEKDIDIELDRNMKDFFWQDPKEK